MADRDVRFPIIYVRGYAMTAAERDETAADPFCGFNAGSTVYRATATKSQASKYVFESPVIRLITEFGYENVYQDGLDIIDPSWQPAPDENGRSRKGIPAKSIVICRYYDPSSNLHGDGKAQNIKVYAQMLADLVAKVKELVVQREVGIKPEDYRCYLVAHSMGGLVARAFLQNASLGTEDARRSVAKVFTYATPHNGIEILKGNIPQWLSAAEANTFNRAEMSKFLATEPIRVGNENRMDFLPPGITPHHKNWFCMVGTNRGDYEVAQGLVRAFVGNGSDGLVRVANAGLWAREADGTDTPVATAYAYRSHSGYFGIVNSEEAYQNLVRFLFGNIRVDIYFDVTGVALPEELGAEEEKVEGVYQVELLAYARGKNWYLSRRTSIEDSPACRTHTQLRAAKKPRDRQIYLSTVFLANRSKAVQNRGLSYGMTLTVRVPDYAKDQVLWFKGHYEGAELFHDILVLEIYPPEPGPDGPWQVKYRWNSENASNLNTIDGHAIDGGKLLYNVDLPISAQVLRKPGITGKVRLEVSGWS
ncbi:esterase/lipase family protein [Variovorax sp. LjRoot178]|uniref:esterase/lipase family protein n=1 Tax=Variovorax sp. LjRoot178 TaxID=3342277 RepID=UPI003ECEDE71